MSAPPRPARRVSPLGEAARATLRDTAKIVAWGLALYGVVEFVGIKLSAKATGALAAQMVIAEWGAGRLAVAWSDPSAPPQAFRSIAQRAAKGAAAGILAAAAHADREGTSRTHGYPVAQHVPVYRPVARYWPADRR